MNNPAKYLAIIRGGTAEFLTYDEADVQFWRITFCRAGRKAIVRLQIPFAVLRRNSLWNFAVYVQAKDSPMALIGRLYAMALEGGLPIILDGFDEAPKCDKNI